MLVYFGMREWMELVFCSSLVHLIMVGLKMIDRRHSEAKDRTH